MSTGALQAIELTVDLILKLKPESFLDIGVGSGKWGFLFREYTDIWEGRTIKTQWKSQVDGIEIFPPIIQDHQRAMYKRIFIGNAYTLIDELHSYDFVWAFDLLAAFDKPKGFEMIRKMREKTGILLALWQKLNEKTPQKSVTKNPFDARVSSWGLEDFQKAGFSHHKIYTADNGEKEALVVYTEENLDGLGFTRFKQ
jgi:SAM-dependent methyltransferase